jgi:hypothetical protein
MVLNLEQLPEPIAEDIEVQSLALLETVRDRVVVIGGWGVRAWTHEIATRNTMDVDGVAKREDMGSITRTLREEGLLAASQGDWGVRFHKRYSPSMREAEEAVGQSPDFLREIELRIEVSQPRIYEKRTPHYFEFDLGRAVWKRISSRRNTTSTECRVADISELAANKIGLPADYKNIFDLALLLDRCPMDNVVRIIKSTDDWKDVVLRRIPKIIGRVQREDSMANMLMKAFGIDIDGFVQSVERIRLSII